MNNQLRNSKLMPTSVGKEMLTIGGSMRASTSTRPKLHTTRGVTGNDHLDEETMARFRHVDEERPIGHRRE